MQTTVLIQGMSSAHSVRAVFTALGGVSGIDRADVTLGKAVIEHDGTVSADAIREAVAIAGYEIGDVTENRRTLPIAQ
jgi:copper chaperone CopZ